MGRKIKSVAIYTNNGTPFYEIDKYLMKPDPEDQQKRIPSDTKVTKVKIGWRKKRIEVFFYTDSTKVAESTIFEGFNFSVAYWL